MNTGNMKMIHFCCDEVVECKDINPLPHQSLVEVHSWCCSVSLFLRNPIEHILVTTYNLISAQVMLPIMSMREMVA